MTAVIRIIAEYLNMLKDFNTLYRVGKKNFILHYQEKIFIVKLEEIDNKENLNDYELIDKYCK
jgi:hypothetical protein